MKSSRVLLVFALGLSMFVAGCKKKIAVQPPPPATPVTTPSVAENTPEKVPVTISQPAVQERRENTPDAATRARISELLARIQDAYFDYDKHHLREDAQATLLADSHALTDILKQYPEYKLTVEGYCDERGSAEYNMSLGDARAKAAKAYLTSLGIPGDQLQTISYGKERPVCTEQTEECYQKNRRAHIVAQNQ